MHCAVMPLIGAHDVGEGEGRGEGEGDETGGVGQTATMTRSAQPMQLAMAEGETLPTLLQFVLPQGSLLFSR